MRSRDRAWPEPAASDERASGLERLLRSNGRPPPATPHCRRPEPGISGSRPMRTSSSSAPIRRDRISASAAPRRRPKTIESIAKLCLSESDPVRGAGGPPRRLWSNLGGAAKRDQRRACGANVRRAVAHDRPGFGAARAPDIGNNNAGCRAAAAAAGRRRRRAGGSFRNCSPYSRTMAIAGLSRMPTLPRSPTKAHSTAIRRTTSSAVKIGRRGGASSVMGEKSATCAAALSKLTEKWCG